MDLDLWLFVVNLVSLIGAFEYGRWSQRRDDRARHAERSLDDE